MMNKNKKEVENFPFLCERLNKGLTLLYRIKFLDPRSQIEGEGGEKS